VLLASSLNEGCRLQDRDPSSHKLPSFVSFFLSFFPAAVAICSCVGDSFATQEFVFFFLGFFGVVFVVLFAFLRASD
jgi:drug/metabolite transporter (DMT)-like permease